MKGTPARQTVGVDFGETNVKLVCLASHTDGVQLVAHGFFRRTHTTQLQEAFGQDVVRRGRIRVNIEDPSLKIRRVEVPVVPDEELPEVITWALKDVVASAVHDYVVRFHRLPGEGSEGRIPYLVYAVHREAVAQHLAYLKGLGLPKPEIVEPNAAALFGSFMQSLAGGAGESFVLVDMGSAYSLFAAMTPRELLFSRPLAGISGNALTKQLSRDMGITEEDAEHLKLDMKRATAEQQKRLTNSVSHFITRVTLEVQRSLEASAAQFPHATPKKLFLSGGGATLAGLRERLADALELEVTLFDPFQHMVTERLQGPLGGKKHYYGLACGLALDGEGNDAPR